MTDNRKHPHLTPVAALKTRADFHRTAAGNMLRTAQDLFDRGELAQVVVVAKTRNGGVTWLVPDQGDLLTLVAAMRRAEHQLHRYLDACTEGHDGDDDDAS